MPRDHGFGERNCFRDELFQKAAHAIFVWFKVTLIINISIQLLVKLLVNYRAVVMVPIVGSSREHLRSNLYIPTRLMQFHKGFLNARAQ